MFDKWQTDTNKKKDNRRENDDSGSGFKTAKGVKMNFIAYENENRTKTTIMISSCLNIAFPIKTYSILQTITNKTYKQSTDEKIEVTNIDQIN